MKKYYFLLLMFLVILNCAAQQKEFVKDVNIVIYSPGIQSSTKKVKQFIERKNVQILSLKESEVNYNIEFYISESDYAELDSLLPSLGFVQSKTLSSFNNSEKTNKLKLELQYLTDKKKAYDQESNTMTNKDDRYYRYWEEIRAIEKKIFELQTELKELEAKNMYRITLALNDESIDMTERNINWVNMPGVYTDFLFVESPNPAISAQQYWGYGIKYMITRGKAAVTLGAMKEYSSEPKDSTCFKELFLLGFGQDFYSKYFGRGKNKFLNLYTGYNAGGVFATGDKKKASFLYLVPFLGVELFKNKYILIDCRGGYFVPLSYNRNLRGVYCNASFNFVF